jgi:hypothetical protein
MHKGKSHFKKDAVQGPRKDTFGVFMEDQKGMLDKAQ